MNKENKRYGHVCAPVIGEDSNDQHRERRSAWPKHPTLERDERSTLIQRGVWRVRRAANNIPLVNKDEINSEQ